MAEITGIKKNTNRLDKLFSYAYTNNNNNKKNNNNNDNNNNNNDNNNDNINNNNIDNNKVKTTTTQLMLTITSSENSQMCRISRVSNSRITPEEFNYYINNIKKSKHNLQQLTEYQIEQRKIRMQKAIKHNYTHEEIQEMVQVNYGVNKYVTTEYALAREILNKKLLEAKKLEKNDENDKLVMDIEKMILKFDEDVEKQKKHLENAAKKQVQVNIENKKNNRLNFFFFFFLNYYYFFFAVDLFVIFL
jgi:hypothetical protein